MEITLICRDYKTALVLWKLPSGRDYKTALVLWKLPSCWDYKTALVQWRLPSYARIIKQPRYYGDYPHMPGL